MMGPCRARVVLYDFCLFPCFKSTIAERSKDIGFHHSPTMQWPMLFLSSEVTRAFSKKTSVV